MSIPAQSTITISTTTVIKVAVALFALWVLYLTADILLLVLAAIFLTAAIGPWVDRLQKHHIPRPVSMLAIYAILFAVLSSAVLLIVPPVAEQAHAIAQEFPNFYNRFTSWAASFSNSSTSSTITPAESLQNISQTLTTATQGAFSTVSTIFGGLFSFLMVLVMTFYLVVDEGAVDRTLAVMPDKYRAHLARLYESLQIKIGLWLRAQLILMGLVALLVYIVLSAVGMKYALVLAIIAGLTEFIPYLGPFIGAIPGIILAFAISPTMAIVVAACYYAVQLFENNVLVPKIMQRALGLSPFISIIVFLVGAKLGGMAGAFLAIPVATAAQVIISDIRTTRRKRITKTT